MQRELETAPLVPATPIATDPIPKLSKEPKTLFTKLCFSGGCGEGDTPVPIPNTAVKPLSADGTARVSVWESRSLPESNSSSPLPTLPRAGHPIGVRPELGSLSEPDPGARGTNKALDRDPSGL